MKITDAAIEKFKEIMKKEAKGSCLRIFMTKGCCGPSVAMDVAAKPDKEDVELDKNGLKLYVHKDAAAQLVNATIDCGKNGAIKIDGLAGDGGCGCH